MKKLILYALGIITIFLLVACQKSEDTDGNKESEDSQGMVTISVQGVSDSGDNVEVILKNTSDEEYIYGESYYIEKDDNGWVQCEAKEGITFSDIGKNLKAGSEVVVSYNINNIYGNLETGHYRIVIDVFPLEDTTAIKTLSAEFDID